MTAAPGPGALLAALEATWPPAAQRRLGPWCLRDGQGGGKRVSAASAEAAVGGDDIAAAEAAMSVAGQVPLFRLCPGLHAWDADLDAALQQRGYRPVDPTLFCIAPAAALVPEALPPLKAFALWPPLAIQREIWAAAGVGPERLAVMARAAGTGTSLMGRQSDRVAGTAFVACHGAIAMLHAVEVAPALRRQGVARNLTQAAADWALAQGAHWLALAVTEANAPARALYRGMGMTEAGGYAYRIAPQQEPA